MKEGTRVDLNWWRDEADKLTTIIIILMHVIAIGAFVPAFFSWSGVVICVLLYWVTGGLGITLCFHRLLTHQSFRTPYWFRAVLTACGCLALQGSPIVWVGTHRYHHQHSDTDEDPHTPKHGFTWAHILWILTKSPDGFDGSKLAPDLQKEAMVRWLGKFFWLPQVMLTVLLFGIGWVIGGYPLAVSWVVWGIGLRTVLVFHNTWFVNSAAHTWGYKNFPDTGENSRNLWWVALTAFGEGWHNNHHGEPISAAHGMRWFELDPTYWTIIALSWFGLASDIRRPKKLQQKL